MKVVENPNKGIQQCHGNSFKIEFFVLSLALIFLLEPPTLGLFK